MRRNAAGVESARSGPPRRGSSRRLGETARLTVGETARLPVGETPRGSRRARARPALRIFLCFFTGGFNVKDPVGLA